MPDMTSLREALAQQFNQQSDEPVEAPQTQEAPVQADNTMAQEQPVEQPTEPVAQPMEQPVMAQQPPMVDNSAQMAQMMQIIQSLQQQNQQLQNAMQQQSQAQAESIVDQINNVPVQEPNPAGTSPMPSLNFAELQYMSQDEQAEELAKYTTALAQYAEAEAYKKLSSEFEPIKRDYEQKRRVADMDAARSYINSDSRFADFANRQDSIDRIIANTKEFEGLDPQKQYLYAGLMARGLDYQAPKEMTTQELIDKAMSNPDVLKAISERNASDIQQRNAQIPKLAASNGISTANAIPENRPTSINDVRSRMRNAFGI